MVEQFIARCHRGHYATAAELWRAFKDMAPDRSVWSKTTFLAALHKQGFPLVSVGTSTVVVGLHLEADELRLRVASIYEKGSSWMELKEIARTLKPWKRYQVMAALLDTGYEIEHSYEPVSFVKNIRRIRNGTS